MAKVTIQMVTDAGFRAEQFGTPADYTTEATGYLARVIADASAYVQGEVGAAAYDAVADGTVDELRLRRAELAMVKAELWRRRAAFLDSNANSSLEGVSNGIYLERREFLKHADEAEAMAATWLGQFRSGGLAPAVGSGAAMGHTETGPFRSEANP